MVKPYVPASVLFADAREELEYIRGILASFDADDTIMLCAVLNQSINKPNSVFVHKQASAVEQIITHGEKKKLDKHALEHGGASNVYIFTRPQLLYMIQLSCQYCKKSDEFPFFSLKNRRELLKCVMATGKLVTDAIGMNRPLDHSRRLDREDLAGAVRASQDLVSPEPNMMESIARGTELFLECMPVVAPHFSSTFHARTKINLEEYFSCVISLQANYEGSTANKYIYQFNEMADKVKDRTTYKRFLDLETCTTESLRHNIAQTKAESTNPEPLLFKFFREKPIFRATDNRATIIDPLFLYQKASIGPLFHVLCPDHTQDNEWFSAFGKAYELYACNILRRMYGSQGGLTQRLWVNEPVKDDRSEDLVGDAFLNDGCDLVLFEAKAVLIPEQASTSDDPKAFVRMLYKKYGLSYDSDGRPTEKGVYQLAKLIKAVELQARSRNSLYASVRTIYPVLLVHDVALNSPITSEILQAHFQSAFGIQEQSHFDYINVGTIRVSPLIIMTIEDIEALEYSIANFSLVNLFKDYSLHSTVKPLSLRNFIAFSNEYNPKLRRNLGMLNRAEQYLMKSKEYLFYD